MILLTGGTGLVGSHLLYEITRSNTPVRAIYRDAKRIERVKKVFDFYSKGAPNNFELIEWVEADVLDLVQLEDTFAGITEVYHCAAMVSFARRDFSKMMHINREGTNNVLNLSLEYKIKKFGYISSTAAIGGQENTLTTEDTKWKQSPKTSGYSITKYSAEKEVWRAVEEGLDVVIVNPCLVIGAGNWDESSMTIFRTVKKGLKFYTPGQNALVDARDIATILVRLMQSEVKNDRFLIISENLPFTLSLQQIAAGLGKKGPTIATPRWLIGLAWRLSALGAWITGSKPTITRDSANSAFAIMEYSNEKVSKLLDYKFIPVKEAIQNAVDFHRFSEH